MTRGLAPAPAITPEEFRVRATQLLDELAGDEGRLWLALRAWLRRVHS